MDDYIEDHKFRASLGYITKSCLQRGSYIWIVLIKINFLNHRQIKTHSRKGLLNTT